MTEYEARIVSERNEAFDMQSGPYGYERIGFEIGGRVFWVGCCGSHSGPGTWTEDKHITAEIVRRWNRGFADSAEVDSMRNALLDIRDAHVPDQPATSQADEATWLMQHIGRIRKIAKDTLERVKP